MTSTLLIKNDPAQLALLYEFLEQLAGSCGISMPQQMEIKLALDEAVTNVIQYAYPGTTGDIRMDVVCENGQLKITITDKGIAFNPLENKEPDVTLPLEERPIGGLGIFLVKQLMTDVSYQRSDGYNILKMTKDIQ